MKLNSLVRAAGALRIKQAMGEGIKPPSIRTPAQPQGGAQAPPPMVMNPMAAIQQKTTEMLSQSTMMKNPFAPKMAGAMDGLGRILPLVAEDGAEYMIRNALRTGANVASVPVAVDRIHQVDDPNFHPDQTANNIRRALNVMSKFSSAGASAAASAPADNQSRFYAPYTPQKFPWDMASPKTRISSAFNLAGSGSHFDMPNEGNTAVSSFPKIAGPGNAQEENRGGFTDQSSMMHNHLADQLAGGGLTTEDNVSQAFTRLRAFMKQDTASMNMPNDNLAGGPDVLA